jgi:hypothetical protein
MIENRIARNIAVAVTSLAALVGCERKEASTSKDGQNHSQVSTEPNKHEATQSALTQDQFTFSMKDLAEPGFLLYVNSTATQGRVVFDAGKSVAGVTKRGDFELVGRVPATRGDDGLWDPMIIKPTAYSKLADKHSGIEIKDWAAYGEMR